MRGKLKKIFNNKIFVFILGGLLFSVVSVYAVTYFPSNQVTYDNSSSKLNSTNVQGAIDELYKTCQAASSVSSGDYIYFYVSTSSLAGFYRIPVNGGAATKIQESGGYYTTMIDINNPVNFVIYKDYIYFFVNSGDSNILGFYRIPVNGGVATKIQETGSFYTHTADPYSFTVSGDYIYFYVSTSGLAGIYRIPVKGGAATKIQESGVSLTKVGGSQIVIY